MPADRLPPDAPWVSASELAEYAFCPRALYYRHHPPAGPADPAARASAERGVAFHARTLEEARHRASAGYAGPIAAVLVGLLLLAAVWALGFL
jgi:hypothetical protein